MKTKVTNKALWDSAMKYGMKLGRKEAENAYARQLQDLHRSVKIIMGKLELDEEMDRYIELEYT